MNRYSDPHLALAASEHTSGPPLTCCECGQPAQGNIGTDTGEMCDACHVAYMIEWGDPDAEQGGRVTGYTPRDCDECPRASGITIAYLDYAEEGEAEGGLVALARFMVAAFRPDVQQPPLSPAGYYWQGTTDKPGEWRKGGPFPTREAAQQACIEAFARGTYLTAR